MCAPGYAIWYISELSPPAKQEQSGMAIKGEASTVKLGDDACGALKTEMSGYPVGSRVWVRTLALCSCT